MREVPWKIAFASRTLVDSFQNLHAGEVVRPIRRRGKRPVMVERDKDREVRMHTARGQIGDAQRDAVFAQQHLRLGRAQVIPPPVVLHFVADHEPGDLAKFRVLARVAIHQPVEDRTVEEYAFLRCRIERRRTLRNRRRIGEGMHERRGP